MTQRKKNIAGFVDEQGRFRPIRSPQFVGSPSRPAKKKDAAKYSRAKAGDLGKRRQAFALEDVFDKEIRRNQEKAAKQKRERERYKKLSLIFQAKERAQFVEAEIKKGKAEAEAEQAAENKFGERWLRTFIKKAQDAVQKHNKKTRNAKVTEKLAAENVAGRKFAVSNFRRRTISESPPMMKSRGEREISKTR